MSTMPLLAYIANSLFLFRIPLEQLRYAFTLRHLYGEGIGQERQPKMYRLPLYYLLLTFACSINLFFFTKCLYLISKDFL